MPESDQIYYYVVAVDTAGNESPRSNLVAWTAPGKLMFLIPDSSEEQGKDVRLPVSITNADGLTMGMVNIVVSYNQNVLEYSGIERSPLSADYGWSRGGADGLVAATLAGDDVAETLHGEGALFYLLFKVVGTGGQQTELKFNVNETMFREKGAALSLPLHLEDTGLFTVSDCYFLGDVDGNCKVEGADAQLTLEIAVGNLIPTKKQRNAADVDADGDILSNDAALVLKLAAGETLAPKPSGTERRSLRSDPVTVSLPDNLTVARNGNTWVPVNISDASGVMGSYIVINYDPALVSAQDVRTTSMTDGFDWTMNNKQSGQVRIGMSATKGEGITSGSGALVEVKFTGMDGTSGTSPLVMAAAHLNDTYSRDFKTSALQIPVTLTDGALKVEGDAVVSPELKNAILALKIAAGMNTDGTELPADVNNDQRIGLAEAIHLLKTAATPPEDEDEDTPAKRRK